MRTIDIRLKSMLSHWPSQDGGSEGFHITTKDTGDMPTEKALYGMFECAFGYTDEYKEEKAQLGQRVHIRNIRRTIPNSRPFRRIGYLTTCSPTIKGEKFPTGSGKYKDSPPSMTVKKYIVDSDYTVTVDIDDSLANEFIERLRHPRFAYYFGMRCCTPTVNLFDTYKVGGH